MPYFQKFREGQEMRGLIIKKNSSLDQILQQHGYKDIDIIFFETKNKPIEIYSEHCEYKYFLHNQYLYNKKHKQLIKSNNEKIKLTLRFHKLLEYLLEHKNQKLFTYDTLAKVISQKDISKETVKSAVSSFNKLFETRMLLNEYGIGYKLSDEF